MLWSRIEAISGVDDRLLRLRAYLLGLTPQLRQRLRDRLRRVTDPVVAPVLAELRRLGDEEGEAAARLFFQPLEPFLIDDDPARGHPGRIARTSLPALWAWVRHDLAPDATAAFVAALNAALARGDEAEARLLTRDFQDCVVTAFRHADARDDLTLRRLLIRVGTPRGADEATAMRWILRGRDSLAVLATRLPAWIAELPRDDVTGMMTLVDEASYPRELRVHALLTVMQRLEEPWQIVRLAVRAAGSDAAARVVVTPYGVAIEILLTDIERQIAALSAALARGDGAAAVSLIRAIDAAIKGLRGEIAIPVASTLGRRLTALSGETAAVAAAALAA